MNRSIKKDITRRYREISSRYKGESGEEAGYVCSGCGMGVRTRQVANGIVPAGIECPFCHETMYVCDSVPDIPVTYEWYRPSLDEVLGMVDGRLFTVNFILGGGLLRRECSVR